VNQQTGFPSVQTIDVGVRLRLTPTIGDDGTITAELHPEYSQIIGFNDSFPIIANRKIDATLRVRKEAKSRSSCIGALPLIVTRRSCYYFDLGVCQRHEEADAARVWAAEIGGSSIGSYCSEYP